jgi:hypothetical protein
VRRSISLILACGLLAGVMVLGTTQTAFAVPVASDENTYQLFGRVFPDPQGCVKGAPGKSPWAKGQVCAAQFLQWQETLDGLAFLEERYPRYLQVINLRSMFGDHPAFSDLDLRSAGLPTEDLSRDKRDLYVIKVTDRESPVAERDRKHFAYTLSIHGIERAGAEGGIRAIEDLVTWAACEQSADAAPACATEGPFPKRILEPSDSGPTAGEVLRDSVVYFVLANPDGWHRGEVSKGGVSFQRYNGNGMDGNRDWPTTGYTEAQYTPASEPETRGYARYLSFVKDQTNAGRFDGAIDLHGMLTAPSFSFTLLGAGQRDFLKNEVSVDTSIRTFRDSEKRLSWSPLIAPAGECPGPIEEPAFGGSVPMCSDQWGTVWDTINYQVTGSFGDWMDSPMGLDAVGIDNEMALSHLTPNTYFDPDIEQLHIDGNKGLIYSQIASLIEERHVQFRPGGKVGYVFDPDRISNPGGDPAEGAPNDLPTQDDIEHTNVTGVQEFRFDVKGPQDGVYNGGLTIEATFANLQGISPNSAASFILDYCGGDDHPGDPEECVEVARYFNQSPLYLQAGARIDLNNPKPGPYRIRPDAGAVLPSRFHVSFSRGGAYPVPEQAAYDVSNMDFFTDLNKYVPNGSKLTPLTVNTVLRKPRLLDRFDTVVVANDFMPGFVPASAASDSAGDRQTAPESRFSQKEFERYAGNLAEFARRGGNLTLSDGALSALPFLGTGLTAEQVATGVFYAGWMDFDDGQGETYDRHPLAAGVNKEGTAEGQANVDEQSFNHRHQTYEPVPLGYYVSQSGSGNSSCDSDRCDSPNWIVDQDAWEAAGGTTAARTLVRKDEEAGGPSQTGASLGELAFGRGRIRIAGALLPAPTEENYHPFGLSSYALTYTGYQLIENLLDYQRPAGTR